MASDNERKCPISGCGKKFSRLRRLRAHVALVHFRLLVPRGQTAFGPLYDLAPLPEEDLRAARLRIEQEVDMRRLQRNAEALPGFRDAASAYADVDSTRAEPAELRFYRLQRGGVATTSLHQLRQTAGTSQTITGNNEEEPMDHQSPGAQVGSLSDLDLDDFNFLYPLSPSLPGVSAGSSGSSSLSPVLEVPPSMPTLQELGAPEPPAATSSKSLFMPAQTSLSSTPSHPARPAGIRKGFKIPLLQPVQTNSVRVHNRPATRMATTSLEPYKPPSLPGSLPSMVPYVPTLLVAAAVGSPTFTSPPATAQESAPDSPCSLPPSERGPAPKAKAADKPKPAMKIKDTAAAKKQKPEVAAIKKQAEKMTYMTKAPVPNPRIPVKKADKTHPIESSSQSTGSQASVSPSAGVNTTVARCPPSIPPTPGVHPSRHPALLAQLFHPEVKRPHLETATRMDLGLPALPRLEPPTNPQLNQRFDELAELIRASLAPQPAQCAYPPPTPVRSTVPVSLPVPVSFPAPSTRPNIRYTIRASSLPVPFPSLFQPRLFPRLRPIPLATDAHGIRQMSSLEEHDLIADQILAAPFPWVLGDLVEHIAPLHPSLPEVEVQNTIDSLMRGLHIGRTRVLTPEQEEQVRRYGAIGRNT